MPNGITAELLTEILRLCHDLNAAGYVPQWTKRTLHACANEKSKTSDGLDGLSFAQARELRDDLAAKLAGQLKANARKARASCRACPAPVLFAVQKGKDCARPNPLCADPQEKGNCRLDLSTMTYDVLTGAELEAARAAGEELYLSHFANCPNRGQFRKAAGA